MQRADIVILIEKYLTGKATEAERLRLERWYRAAYDEKIELDFDRTEAKGRMKQHIFNELGLIMPSEPDVQESSHIISDKKNVRILWRSIAAVAAAMLLFFIAGWILKQDDSSQNFRSAIAPIDLAPGHKGAVLYLSNGRAVVLDKLKDGLIARDGGLKIIKEADGIRYQGQYSNGTNLENRLVTDYGRQWRVTLPDGTKVWLNAVSSIQYPLDFKKKTRTVMLSGEGYFEVVHDATHPFQVVAGTKLIEDIGTAFNINAYVDEPAFITTVVEGSIRLRDKQHALVLSRGQQAVVTDKIQKNDSVDVSTVLAWKEGYFQFQGAGLEEVMRQVSRWYHVEVVYKTPIKPEQFNGRIPKNMPASKVLDILKQAGITFAIKAAPSNGTGGRILVSDSD